MDPKINYLEGINKREDFTKLIDERNYTIGIEIGVDRGAFSAHLLRYSRLYTLYGVDGWWRHPDRKKDAEQALKLFNERSRLIVGSSPEVTSQFQDNFFDFIYIDGNHHRAPVKADLNGWWNKAKGGSCIAGHDYVVAKGCGVMQSVNEFAKEHNLLIYTTRESGPELKDRLISWYFFKP